MLTYKVQTNKRTGKNEMHVYLGKGLAGYIRKIDDGYTYYPKGTIIHGDVFQTVSEVKRSLEAE